MPPVVKTLTVNRAKVSDETGADRALATFTFDIPVQAFTVNVLGVSPDTGTVAEAKHLNVANLRGKTVAQARLQTVRATRLIEADTSIVAEIDYTELYQEGDNRVNIYGKGLDGTWTPYSP